MTLDGSEDRNTNPRRTTVVFPEPGPELRPEPETGYPPISRKLAKPGTGRKGGLGSSVSVMVIIGRYLERIQVPGLSR